MFKKIMLYFLRKRVPINEEPSVTKKCLKVLGASIIVISMVWTFIFIFLLPVWFSEKHVINGHVIYSSTNVDSELLQNVLNITKEKMKKSAIDIPELLPTIYLYNSDIFYYFSMLAFYSNSRYRYEGFLNRIHVRLNGENIYAEKIINKNWLSSVIASQKIQSLQYERYGILTYYLFIPRWVRGGYALCQDRCPVTVYT